MSLSLQDGAEGRADLGEAVGSDSFEYPRLNFAKDPGTYPGVIHSFLHSFIHSTGL